MTTLTKSILALVLAVIIGGAIWGAYQYPKLSTALGTTPAGGTFGTDKIAAIAFAPATGSATSTSILNPAGQDVYVTSSFVGCQNASTSYTAYSGTGLSSLLFKAATTSTANPPIISNTNLVINLAIATGTTASGGTPFNTIIVATSSFATSTNPAIAGGAGTQPFQLGATGYWYLWPANTYLTFWSNATNTATCTIGVKYFSS